MIIVNLKGGMGNQMFQYATGYALSQKLKTSLALDVRFLTEYKNNPPKNYVVRSYSLNNFDKVIFIEPIYSVSIALLKIFKKYSHRFIISKIIDKINCSILVENNRNLDCRFFQANLKNIYLDGYWQNEKYFYQYRYDLLDIFNFNSTKKRDGNSEIIKRFSIQDSVCLNVRRTDFIGSIEHDVINTSYYIRALEYFRNKFGGNLHTFIFSDDIDWCKKNLSSISNVFFIDHEYAGDNFINYLYLMTTFTNFIIPNSTFAWWGAWLSTAENKIVVAPKNWSGVDGNVGIIPEEWIKL